MAINQPFNIDGVATSPDSLNTYLAAHRGFTSRGGEMTCAYLPLGQQRTRVFVWAVCHEFLAIDGRLVEGSGMSLPAAFEIKVDSGQAKIVGLEIPADGDRYGPSARRIFPSEIWPQVFEAPGSDNPAKLTEYLRRQTASRLGIVAAGSNAPHRNTESEAIKLDSAARRIVEFLRGNARLAEIDLSDSVLLAVSPEGGGGRATFSRAQLRRASAWRVKSRDRVFALAPPSGMTRLTTSVGHHYDCTEQRLAAKFPQLARLPHVGTMLEPASRSSCLQTWNMTFVFDTIGPPRLVAALYDQWEW